MLEAMEAGADSIDYIEFIKGLKEEYGFSPKLLEYGAGLAVPYFEGDDHEHVYDSLTTERAPSYVFDSPTLISKLSDSVSIPA